MNNWFKIGMPVLIVILLIVCAVTITLLATRYGSDRPISATSLLPVKASAPYAVPSVDANYPGYTQSVATTAEGSTSIPAYGNTTLPSCHVSVTQDGNIIGGYGRGSCCGGYQD